MSSQIAMSLEEYTDPTNAPAPILMLAPATCKIGIEEISARPMALVTVINLFGQQLPSNHPLILSGWKKEPQ